MSIHVGMPDYECEKCEAIFIPYKTGIICPSCGKSVPVSVVKNYSDLIDKIAESMKIHKCLYGTFGPLAWSTAAMSDHVQDLIFRIFDTLEEKKPENKEEFIVNYLEGISNWGGESYRRKHIEEIALDILPIYNKDLKHIPDEIKESMRAMYDVPF